MHARARAWRVQLRAQDRRRGVLVQVLPITGFLINKFLKQNGFFFFCTIYFKRIFQSILFFRIFPVHTLIWIHTAISFSGFSRSILLFGSIQLLGTLE